MTFSSQTIKFVGLLTFVVLSILIFQLTDLGRYIRPEEIRTAIQSVGPLAPFLYLLIYSVAPVFFVPGWIITIGGGARLRRDLGDRVDRDRRDDRGDARLLHSPVSARSGGPC